MFAKTKVWTHLRIWWCRSVEKWLTFLNVWYVFRNFQSLSILFLWLLSKLYWSILKLVTFQRPPYPLNHLFRNKCSFSPSKTKFIIWLIVAKTAYTSQRVDLFTRCTSFIEASCERWAFWFHLRITASDNLGRPLQFFLSIPIFRYHTQLPHASFHKFLPVVIRIAFVHGWFLVLMRARPGFGKTGSEAGTHWCWGRSTSNFHSSLISDGDLDRGLWSHLLRIFIALRDLLKNSAIHVATWKILRLILMK